MRFPNYLFGDGDIAARRLELLAQVYRESTRAFLEKVAGGARFRLGVDLGCGPGFTTNLIAETLRCDRVVGLEASESFVAIARERGSDRVSFALHDVTAIPFSCGSADLVFCRFLLTHLKEPAAAVSRWATQLNPRGLLMLEEVEAIRTSHPAFTRYLGIVDAMLASQSNRLFVGPMLVEISPPGLVSIQNEVRAIAVSNRDAARMFAMNMSTWKNSAFVRANYSRETIAELEDALGALAANQSSESGIVWEMRQAAWRNR